MVKIKDYLNSKIIDIQPLLALVLQKNSANLIINDGYRLTTKEKIKLDSLIEKRNKGVPFAYLSGYKGFYNSDFKVTCDTLIPRPETEILIDIALDLYDENQVISVLDLGTGSGIIAITLANQRLNWKITAIDICNKALLVAKQNAKRTKINFIKNDWLNNINKKFDLIISNPPYIKINSKYLKELKYEPTKALVAGKEGLDDINKIINNAPNNLNKNGYLLLEHGYDQQAKISKLLQTNFNIIKKFKDYNTKNRAILAQLK
jgi:release factor glutamine methyltransferase